MSELTTNINWLAVGLGTFISFMLGGAWYSKKMFGVKWSAGVGLSNEGDNKQPIPALLMQLLGTFLFAWLIGITAARDALLTAILIVITIVCLLVASGWFTKKSNYAVGAEGGFVLAMAVIMIVCQGIF